MSDKKINIIIAVIVVLSIVVSYELMQHSPKRNEVINIETKQIDKIVKLNQDIKDNFKNNAGYFTVSLNNYELNGLTINMDINVRIRRNNTYIIDSVVVNNNVVNISLNQEIIDFKVGQIKENNKNMYLYLVTNRGSQDGEGDVIVINNNGYVLYQNNSAFIDELNDDKYLIKEKYCDSLISLICNESNVDDVAFRNKTYKSINGQFVIIDDEEIKISDVCYNE